MLTDAQCRNAIFPADKKQKRFADAGGVYLQVSPAGSKRWFLKYRVARAEKQLALGSYPEVTLTAARKAREAAKLQKSEGRDPVQAQCRKAEITDTNRRYLQKHRAGMVCNETGQLEQSLRHPGKAQP